MGKIETEAKRVRRKNYVQQAILASLAVSGAIALTALAPAVVVALGIIARRGGYKFGYRARTAAGRLAARGDVRFIVRNGMKLVEITNQGRKSLEFEMRKAEAKATKRRRWDGRYRLVAFDIPERRRATRRQLSSLMGECSFLRIQDSLWIFPYDCEELIALIKAELRIGKDVLYVVVESIENDKWIRDHFKLRHN